MFLLVDLNDARGLEKAIGLYESLSVRPDDMVIVGTKGELLRRVRSEDIQEFAATEGLPYTEIDSKSGVGFSALQ